MTAFAAASLALQVAVFGGAAAGLLALGAPAWAPASPRPSSPPRR